MSRALHWRVRSKSLTGVDCDVYIYEEGYSGSIIDLEGAATPFFFEEDNSEDMLDVIRYRTGYIRVIEHYNNELSAIYPQTTFDRYVICYYGFTKVFSGYIQLQNINVDWVASPRVVEFPVISPLGLLEHVTFDAINPPRSITLGELMYYTVTKLQAEYATVDFPYSLPNFGGTINSLVVYGYSGDYSPALHNASPLFESLTARQFIEGVCNAYGWMVHDMPLCVQFTKHDHTGLYASYTIANLPSQSSMEYCYYQGSNDLSINNYFTLAGVDNMQSVILPKRKVKLSYEGEYVKQVNAIDFDKLKYCSSDASGSIVAAWLRKGDYPAIIGTYLLDDNSFTNDGHVYTKGVNLTRCGWAVNNNDELKDCILTYFSTTWPTDYGSSYYPIFTVRVYDPPTSGTFILKWNQKWGERIGSFVTDAETNHYVYGIQVRVGEQYYHGVGDGSGVWSSTEPAPFVMSGADPQWPIMNAPDGIVEIMFYMHYNADPNPVPLLAIEDITLTERESVFSEYTVRQSEYDEITGGQGLDDAEVHMLFNAYRENNHMIGTAVQLTKYTRYPYLLEPMGRLQVKFRPTSMTNDLMSKIYAVKWRYWIDSWVWRVVAITFSPWDDEMTLTLHHSPSND